MTILLELARSQWASLAPSACRVLLSTVRALDGEKDPRNLLLYLQLLRQLCVNCEAQRAAGFTEALSEVFDTLISYFPISFSPPPNDPHQITSQHLLQALLRTLRSSAGFAQHALPFFAAKLCETEDNPEETMTTRLQVLQSLALLAPAYGAEALAPHADTIGEALGDLFTPTDQQRPPSMPSEGVGKDSVADDVLSTAVRATLRALASVAGRAGDSNAATAASAYARPSSLMERLVAPSIARCVSAPPQGPGATPAALALEAIHQLHRTPALPCFARRCQLSSGALLRTTHGMRIAPTLCHCCSLCSAFGAMRLLARPTPRPQMRLVVRPVRVTRRLTQQRSPRRLPRSPALVARFSRRAFAASTTSSSGKGRRRFVRPPLRCCATYSHLLAPAPPLRHRWMPASPGQHWRPSVPRCFPLARASNLLPPKPAALPPPAPQPPAS